MGFREPLSGAKRAKQYAELSLELPTEIIAKVGSDGGFCRYKEGDIGLSSCILLREQHNRLLN